jgi:lysophospholipase L1-like esterase
VAGTLNVGGAPVVTLKVRGTTTTTLTLVVDGATTLTASDSTSPLTTAGKAGVWFGVAQTDTTGIHVDSFSASNPSTTPTQKQIIFDGNSLTAGQDSTTGNDYPSQVLALLGSGWTGQNFGVSGQTTTQMSSDAATQIDPLYSTATYLDNWLAAWEVTNDLYFGASATTAYNNYVSYCQARRAAGWKVIAVTVLPRSNSGTPSSFETDRQTCNTNIRANWSTFADVIADVAADARIGDAGDETNPTYYYISGTADTRVHLVDAGYAIIARHVANAVLGKAAAYTLTGASTGAVGQAVTLTLALSPSGRTQSPAAAITLTDNAGGTFSPAAPQLSTASQSVSVSYTPASTGTKTIVGTNTQNLADAQPFSFQAVALGDKKISELPDLTSLSASDYLPIVSGGATKRVTLATLAAWVKTN